MKKQTLLKIGIILLLFLAGCSAPLPTPTPVIETAPTAVPTQPPTQAPRATATPLPTDTPFPAPTATAPPLPTATPAAGYYRHPELGFWFNYPADWFTEETGRNLPAVIISDADDPVQLWAGARAIEEGTTLEDFAHSIKDELGLAESVELLTDGATSLADGSPAWEISLQWEDENGDLFMGRGYAALAATNGYVILLTGRPELIEARPQTVKAIGGGLHLEQPELYGVSRDNALFLLVAEPDTLDPALTREGAAGIVGHIFSGLARLNNDLQIEPDLAESWEISEDSAVYTFHLREEAMFHDGTAVTADDVKTAWERALDPALNSATAPLYLNDISAIAAVDDQTLQVTLTGPRPAFLAKLTQPVAFITQAANVGSGDEWWREPVGTGPFTLNRWQPGQVIVLAANEDTHLTPPNIDTAVFINGRSSFPAYESGLVDFAQVSPHNLSRAQDPGEPLSADLVSGNLLCTQRIIFDTTRPPFDNAAVRHAFSLAVDRQQLAQLVLNDAALPAASILPPGMPGYVERPSAAAFNIEESQSLLADTTLPPITLAAPGAGSPDAVTTALADMWTTHLGADIETRLISRDDYQDDLANQPGHLFLVEWCAGYPDPENMLDLLYHSGSPANFGRYQNEEVDALLEAARSEQVPETRLSLYQQAEELILADAATIQTVHPLDHLLVRPSIQDYQQTLIPLPWAGHITIEREEP
ncbi:MAG: hypothetical protein GY796_02010 [Chloroflexi bacterium]|nr:hypothetical protein [Chloroflexota bacterium]